jgi:hypothetical protein
MKKNRIVFAMFAVAILFSMIREWNAPSACARFSMNQTNVFTVGR